MILILNNFLIIIIMKRIVYIFAVLFLGISSVSAQKLVIEDCDVFQGAITTIPVKYVTEGAKCGGGQLNIELPEGLSLVMTKEVIENEDGEEEEVEIADAELGAEAQGFTLVTSINGFAVFGTKNLPGEEGTLFKFKIQADASLEIGTELVCRVYNIAIPTTDGNVKNEEYTFKVTVVENRLVFDENKPAPGFTAGQKYDAKAIRTIKAGNWSSIVLPFALTAAEYKAIFGDDVHLARLTALNVEFVEGTKEIKNIDLCFTTHPSTSAMMAGRPYIILTSQEKDGAYEISVDGKALQAPRTDQNAEFSEEDEETGDEIKINALFVGTYEGATIPANGIFLNGNKFYTSVGKTKTKGLRGWFDVDAAVGQDMSAAKIGFVVDGEPTSVDGIPSYQRITEGVYDLSGRKIQLKDGDLNKLQKGVYIIDGKKVTIK